MKILIITQRWYPDSFGGSELVAAEQARRLAKRGHEVTVVTEGIPSPQSSPTRGEEDKRVPSPSKGEGSLPAAGRGEGFLRIYRYGSPEQFARVGGRSRTDIEEVQKTMHVILNEAHAPERSSVRGFTPRSEGSRANARTSVRDSSPPTADQNDRILWDIAILHHPFAAYGFFKAGLQIPTLYIFHASTAKEVAFEKTKRWPFLTPLFVWWARRVERAVLRRATRVAVFSEFSRKMVEELVPEVKDKVVKLSVGVDLERFHNSPQPALPAGRPSLNLREGAASGVTNLLTVRRLTPRMGLMELIKAMKIVADRIGQPPLNPLLGKEGNLGVVHLTIVGEGLMRKALEREVERLGLQSCVTLAGRVSAEDLPRYYQNADLFVLPTQAYEGLGMATLEALASGLPVVGTPVGATPEVLRDLDATLIIGIKPPLNPPLSKGGKGGVGTSAKDIAQGILDFFARPVAERESLGKKARELAVDKYNWEKAVEELEQVLGTLIQPH